jgi:mRNA interferase RelE/StbE
VTYKLLVAPSAPRALGRLPLAVHAAVVKLVTGPLLEAPHRVGKPLQQPFLGMWSARRSSYRVLYRIDDESQIVKIIDINHRRAVYRHP